MNKLRAVFWDIDGTLSDTEMLGHRVAFNKAFEIFNIDWIWDEEKYIELLGIGGGKNRIKFYSDNNNFYLSETQINEIHKLKTELYMNIITSGSIVLRNGVSRLIQELNSIGIVQGIVTTSSYLAASSLINNLFTDSNSLFKFIITSDDVKFAKPNPEPYDIAITISNIPSDNILVIEDSLIGLRSASAAGLTCLLTPTIWSKYSLNDMNSAVAIVDSLGNISSPTNIIKGKNSNNGLIDYTYLNNLLIH